MRAGPALAAIGTAPETATPRVEEIIRTLVVLIQARNSEVSAGPYGSSSSPEEVLVDTDLDGHRYLLVRMPRRDRSRVQLSPREPVLVSRYKAAQLSIRFVAIAVEGRNGDRLVDACSPGPAQIGFDRRDRVPRRGHAVAFPGVAVTIDNHGFRHSARFCLGCAPRSFAATARYQTLVAIAL